MTKIKETKRVYDRQCSECLNTPIQYARCKRCNKALPDLCICEACFKKGVVHCTDCYCDLHLLGRPKGPIKIKQDGQT